MDIRLGACIEWWGTRYSSGYGIFIKDRRKEKAHRFIWEACMGWLQEGEILHHKCENKICVNPAHLEILTVAEHNRLHSSQITHCPHGHAYDEVNTFFRKNGARRCRACSRKRELKRYYDKLEARN